MELNPFEWGLPWYYYSIGALVIVFGVIFLVIFFLSGKRNETESLWRHRMEEAERRQTEIGKENSNNNTFSQDSEEYSKWKKGK